MTPLLGVGRYSTRDRFLPLFFVRVNPGRMPAREEPMPKPGKKARQAFWERGYLAHGYWLGKERVGQVKLGPKKEWDGIYRWQAGNHSGGAATLEAAKLPVEQGGLVGASQFAPFGQP